LGGGKRFKEPKRTFGQNLGVAPSTTGSSQNELVRLSFQHFSSNCIADCGVDKLGDWTEKLKRLTACTWQQVMSAPRKGLGHEKIPRDQVTFAVPTSVTPDVEFFLAFRCGSAARMIGFRDDGTLQVLWVAEQHDAY
jgi:hypothetical protein